MVALQEAKQFKFDNGNKNSNASTVHLFPSEGDLGGIGSHTCSGHGLSCKKHLLHLVNDKWIQTLKSNFSKCKLSLH